MRVARGIRLAGVVGLVVVALTACGGDDSDGASSSTSQPAGSPLVGTQWVLRDSRAVPTAGLSLTATFDNGRISGNSGCNRYNAPYSAEGGRMRIGPDIALTQMSCAAPATEVETAFVERLGAVRAYAIAGSALQMQDDDGGVLLTFEAFDAEPLLLGTWIVTGYYTGDAVESVAGPSVLTAAFSAETVSGDGGCNTFSGPYETDEDAITMGPFQSTLRSCADPALQTQEQHYLEALELATSFRVTPDRLELLRRDGGFAVTFESATPTG